MNEARYSSGLIAAALLYGSCCSCSATKSPERVPPVSTWQVAVVPAAGAAAAAPSPAGWPRRFEEAGNSFAVYQPQIDSWEGDRLRARSAVSVTKKGTKEPRVGVIWLEARTDVNKPARVVTLDGVTVTKASFPHDESTAPAYVEAIRKHVSSAAREVPLDLLETNLAAGTAAKAGAAVEVMNDPPRIVFTTVPSVLVLIDGDPVLLGLGSPGGAPATTTSVPPPSTLKRVVNTRALMLFDEAARRYYLYAMNAWVSAAAPEGPWSPVPAKDLPPAVDAARQAFAKDPTVDLLEPTAPEVAPKQVITSTQPTELIQTRGAIEFAPLPGTNLEYVSNTDAAVFRDAKTQKHYVLVSGRWFSASSVEGPWAHVEGKELPQDFQKIPPDGPKANVLVSVPGTPQAREAVVANSIPQTAAVKISEATLTVKYDGEPTFKPIAGVKGLQYATNTVLPVILIEGDKTYWCVENGIWFTAKSPAGPWAVATSVPGAIYTIPASHPLHYVTYVRVYGTAAGVVYVGYTPGYMGTCVTSDGVVVYGTGYSYPAYVGTVWVGYPPTYGYGAGFSYGAAGGFAFGFAAGAMVGGCWSQPYWGPYYGGGYRYGDVDINTSNVYRNGRGGVTSANRHYGYDWEDNRTNVSGRGATFNPYSNKVGVGGYSGHYDWDNNEYKMNRAGASYDRDTNDVRMAGSKITGDVDEGTKTVKRGAAEYDRDTGVVKGGGARTKIDQEEGTIDRETGKFRYNTNTDTGIARKGDDLYIGHDDNVYRRTEDGWQQKTDDGWKDAQRDPNASGQTRDLDRQRQSREVGEARTRSYQQSNASRGGYAGGESSNRGGSTPSYRSSSPSRSSPAPSRGGGYGGGSRGGGARGGGGRR